MPRPSRSFKSDLRHPSLDYRPPGWYRALRAIALALAGLAIAGALYVGFWFYMAGQLRDGIAAWAEARRAEGLAVSYDKLDIGGFPLVLDVRLDKPRIADREWAWETDALSAWVLPWNLNEIMVHASNRHRIVRTIGGRALAYGLRPDKAEARLTLDGGHLVSADIALQGATLNGPGEAETWTLDRLSLTASMPPGDPAPEAPSARTKLRLSGLRVPARVRLPLGPVIGDLEIDADVMGPIPAGPLVETLSAWRDAGGTVEMPRVIARYGPLGLQADGTLALDQDLQPIGAFTARVEGFFETVDALRERGLIRSADAATAKLVLGVLARPGADGRPGISLPLTIQDRRLHAGPVALMEIPPIIWPGGR